MYAVSNTQLARNLQRTGHFHRLLGDLFFTAGTFLVALLISFFCLFASSIPSADGTLPPIVVVGYLMVFMNLAGCALLVPLGHKLWLLLSNLRPDNGGSLE